MEKSLLGSSINHTEEESGWTGYFEDFSNSDRDHSSSSLVSDAASLPPWKVSSQKGYGFGWSSSSLETPKKLSSNRKTGTKEVSDDDSLKDTATSPSNSPKVGYVKTTDTDLRKGEEHLGSSLGK